MASKDGESTEEIGDRVLCGEGDGDTDDSRTSEQWRDFDMEDILQDEKDGDEPDDSLDDTADEVQQQFTGGVGFFVLPLEMLRPSIVNGVDDAKESRQEDDIEKGKEGLPGDNRTTGWA